MKRIPMLAAAALLAGGAIFPTSKGLAEMDAEQKNTAGQLEPHPYVGMWVTGDGRIRHNLLPNGRYDEARGDRESAYQGRYEVRGNYVYYWDDTGFEADGEFIDDVLHHAGMILYRRKD